MLKTTPRSFGFTFRDKFLQGTLLQETDNNSLDIYFHFESKEFPTFQNFIQLNNLTHEETQLIESQVNKFLKLPN